MALIRTGTTKIRTGASRVIQQAPPQRISRRERRETPQKEIAFITETKKLEEARGEIRRDRRRRREEEPRTITELVQEVKDSGLGGAEAGYALSRLFKTAEVELKPELKAWCDTQISQYQKVMEEAKAEYKAELDKLKDKYPDDPIKFTNARLKLIAKVYPKWSSKAQQAKENFEERQDTLAKAITAAKEAGIKDISSNELYAMATTTKASAKKQAKEKGITDEQLAAIRGEKYEEKLPTVTTTELPKVINATAEEIKKAEDAKAEADARGWVCHTTIQIFKVKLSDGRTILVEALDSPSRSGKASAEAKAKAAGYKVAWVTKQMPGDKPVGKTITQIKPGTVDTLTGFEIPREWLMASSEVHESMGIKKVDGQYQLKVIATAEGQFMPKEVYDALPDKYQDLIVEKGMDAYQEAADADSAKFQNWLKDLENDYPGLYEVYKEKGYDALENAIEQQATKQDNIIATLDKKYKLDDGYDITAALTDKAVTADELKLAGFKDDDIKTASEAAGLIITNREELEKDFLALPKEKFLAGAPGRESQQWYIKEYNAFAQYVPGEEIIPDKPYNKLNSEQREKLLEWYAVNRPEYWSERAKETGKVALAFVPIAGTIAYWKDMSPTMRAISVVGDVFCLAFILHGATAAARATKGYTAASRVQAAVKGAGQAILAEAVAPIDMAAHPIATAKGIGRQVQSAIETLVHPKKIPLGATELAYTTTRLPVDDVGGAKKAMELRDAAVAAAIQGKPGKATIGDVTLELTPAELQKVGGPLAVHATPDIRPYLNGAVIQSGAEGSGMFISPNFHSRFAQATAFGDVPEGGIKGGLLIRDENVLKALTPTGKTYMSTAEIEALLKPGTTLPSPSQVLFTRDIAGNKLTFLVIGKPYTQSQIAKLKFLGSLDTMAQVFKPTMTLTGAERTAINAMDDIIELAQERATLARQLEAARAAGRTATVQTLNQKIAKLDDRIDNLVKRVNAPREAIRPTDLVWAQYADKGILERYKELNPKRAQATDRGTRLPAIRPALALRAAVPRTRGKITGKEPYVTVRYKKGETTGYAPGYAPSYVPVKAPPYAPVKVPAAAPPPTPPYVPTRAPTARPPRLPFFGKPTKPPIRKQVTPIKLGRERIPRQPSSLVSWRQGAYYVTIVDPFRTTGTKPDVVYSRSKPPHAKVVTGKRSPQKTLTTIGKVPQEIKLGMGVVTARVKHGRILGFQGRGRLLKGRRRR